MGRKRFSEMNCGIGQALEALGDWWTLLIVRDAFFGARRFGDFESSLGIAKNILSARLQHLVDHGIIERVDVGSEGHRFEYRLTDKGRDLYGVIVTLADWGDEHMAGKKGPPVERVHRLEVPMPYAPNLEALVTPDAARVVAACKRALYLE